MCPAQVPRRLSSRSSSRGPSAERQNESYNRHFAECEISNVPWPRSQDDSPWRTPENCERERGRQRFSGRERPDKHQSRRDVFSRIAESHADNRDPSWTLNTFQKPITVTRNGRRFFSNDTRAHAVSDDGKQWIDDMVNYFEPHAKLRYARSNIVGYRPITEAISCY